MPTFIYSAKSDPQKTTQGKLDAESEQDAINKLTRLGLFPITVNQENILEGGKERAFGFKKFSRKDLASFTSQLSTLIESGVNIINAINIISNQTTNNYLKSTLNDITDRVKDGKSLSDSLAAHPKMFSNLYTSIVKTGEASGNLKDVLKRLAGFMEKEEEFKDSLRASLTYPIFVFSVGVLTVAVLLIFVIPRLVGMFEDIGQALPLPTKILIETSNFMRNYWWILLALILIAVFSIKRSHKNAQGRIFWDTLKLKTAIIGQIILKTEISRLMRTLSLLLSSGVPVTTALNISSSVISNQVLKNESLMFEGKINSGSSLSEAMKSSKNFPEFVTNIVAIGEETGSLDRSLLRIADDYETAADRSLKALTRIFEPFIILVMGLIVGFIVLAMLLPIFQMNLIVR
ncbi:MAG: type II secretion system F family protein [Candidatus Omnitrophica bacterium]|nr:type II secretion system F family protein [Candidatus Omnitrophota bacterium]MBU1870239.1 type II secretion system F family protein [Candidatus Omnitrophota bacterium]